MKLRLVILICSLLMRQVLMRQRCLVIVVSALLYVCGFPLKVQNQPQVGESQTDTQTSREMDRHMVRQIETNRLR